MPKSRWFFLAFAIFLASQAGAELPKAPLDLTTAQRIALEANPSLAAAEARIQQAKARIDQTRAAYWPTLDGGGSWSRVDVSDAATLPGQEDPETHYRASITATVELFDGFARKFSKEAAVYGREESEAARLDAQRRLLAQVAAAYFNAQKARESISISEADARFNRQQLEEARIRRRVGTGSLSDEMNFEVRVNSARANVIQAEQSFEVAMAGLAGLLGLPEGAFSDSVSLAPLAADNMVETALPAELSPEELVRHALENRPDARGSDSAMDSALAGVGSARSALFPTVKLSGALDGSRADDPVFESDNFGNSVMLSVGFRFFDGGVRRARIAEANARRTEAEHHRQQARISIASEVRQAIVQLNSAKKQLELEASNQELVALTRDLVEKEYAAGQASLVRLNEAQRDLIQATGRLLTTRINLQMAKVNLDAATGLILKKQQENP